MSNIVHYRDASGAERELILIDDSVATPIDPQVETRFTNVNLQRRVNTDDPDKYQIAIHSKHSYRTITTSLHDEASEDSEIP